MTRKQVEDFLTRFLSLFEALAAMLKQENINSKTFGVYLNEPVLFDVSARC